MLRPMDEEILAMPISKFHDLDAAARALPASPSAEIGLRTALVLSRLDEATRRGIRISQRGVVKYETIAEAESARESFALRCLREAGPEPTVPSPAA